MDARSVVHVVDESALVRATIAALLTSDGLCVRSHTGPDSLLAELHKNGGAAEAGCVLAEIHLPRIDGIAVMTRLRVAGARMPVILMSDQGDVATVVRAIKLGAADFIAKPLDAEALRRAVRAALSTGPAQASGPDRNVSSERIARLTVRERQILDQILVGRKHREIGEALGISPRTVEVFRSRVMVKMECENVQELVRVALAGGCAGDGRSGMRAAPYGADHTG